MSELEKELPMLIEQEKKAVRKATRFEGDVVWGTAKGKSPDMCLAEFRGVKFTLDKRGQMVPDKWDLAHQATLDLAASFDLKSGQTCKSRCMASNACGEILSDYMLLMHAFRADGERIFNRWESAEQREEVEGEGANTL